MPSFQDDLQKVTKFAYDQVSLYGMSERVGDVVFKEQQDDGFYKKLYSEETARIIDEVT